MTGILAFFVGLAGLIASPGQAWADGQQASTGGANPSAGMQLQPTTTCPQESVDEISRAIQFVRSRAWADSPANDALTIAPDLTVCQVVLHIGHLTDREEAALQAGAGSRLAIEYRRDWARPSRVLLILWAVFGGSGLIWIYRRYARG
jgi:hypothetical protein